MDFAVVIPARYDSVRLPGKPLLPIAGRPMIEWVWKVAVASGAADIIVATDDVRIETACRGFGAQVALTGKHHTSGTDRIAEVALQYGWPGERVVVNLQGDEPAMPAANVAQVARLLVNDHQAQIATLATAIDDEQAWRDPSLVKVVVDDNGRALYFSRAAIPYHRDSAGLPANAMGHLGLYAYRVDVLKTLTATKPCALELAEKLEQLRALWLGMTIRVELAAEDTPSGVDTEQDLDRMSRLLTPDP